MEPFVAPGLLATWSHAEEQQIRDDVELLKWAETYWTSADRRVSFADHSRMFCQFFPGTKFRLETREQATILLADLRACVIAL